MKLFGTREPIEPLGSALVFLNPVPWEVLESAGCRRILSAISLEAPELIRSFVVITSTWRPGEDAFSYHHRFEAIDWRTGVDLPEELGAIVAPTREARIEIAEAWADRIRDRCGREFDVIYGDARHIDHGHAERDGRKVARVYSGG